MKFEQWFNENYDDLVHLLKTDQQELLYKAWLAGYETGMDYMTDFVTFGNKSSIEDVQG